MVVGNNDRRRPYVNGPPHYGFDFDNRLALTSHTQPFLGKDLIVPGKEQQPAFLVLKPSQNRGKDLYHIRR